MSADAAGQERRSDNTQAAPEAAAVTASTEGQGPIRLANGWEAPKAPR